MGRSYVALMSCALVLLGLAKPPLIPAFPPGHFFDSLPDEKGVITMTGSDARAIFEGLCEFADDAMQRHRVPGAAVGVAHEGEDYLAGFGVTSVENPLAVNTDTIFQIGSISKTFTATAIMILVDRGELDLDVPLVGYLPDLRLSEPEVTQRVTMRHLLTHTSGWEGNFSADTGQGDDALVRYVAEMHAIPQLTQLGEAFVYSNSGFSLAGRIIEVITGKTFEAAVRELVLDPLGLDHSFYFPAEVMLHRFAAGHFVKEEGVTVARPWPTRRSARPYAGVFSTVHDQLAYAHFHMGDGRLPNGTRIMSQQALTAMHEPITPAYAENKWALSWAVQEIANVRLVYHFGDMIGHHATLYMAPAHRFAISVLTNTNWSTLKQEVVREAIKRYLAIEEPDPQEIQLSEDDLSGFLGQYDGQLATIELVDDGANLVLSWIPKGSITEAFAGKWAIKPCGRDRFFLQVDQSAQGDFLRDASDRVVWLRWWGSLYRKMNAELAHEQVPRS